MVRCSLFLLAAFLLGILSLRTHDARDRSWRDWRFLSLVFVYLSADEVAGIHEMLQKPMTALFHFKGILYYAWVLPAALLVLIFLWRMYGFLRTIAPETRTAFMAAGIIFVTGAIGVEMLEGWRMDTHGADAVYGAIVVVEEGLEKVALILFDSHLLDLVVSSTAEN